MTRLQTLLCTASVLTVVAGTASAASFTLDTETTDHSAGPGVVGTLGASLGHNNAKEVDGGTADEDKVGFATLEGSIGYYTGSVLYGVVANLRFDDFASGDGNDDFSDDEDPEWQSTITAHLLFDVGSASRAGAFFQYGDTLPQDGDGDDAYDHYLLGIEGQSFLADNVVVFGQLALGNKVREGQDEDEGFHEGISLRTGMTYFATDRTSISGTFEYAGSQIYIDGDDPGRHFGLGLVGKTTIGGGNDLHATYGAKYHHFNSTDEGDQIDEFSVFAGLEWAFGATSQKDQWMRGMAIGSPELPVRASAWTEWMD